MSKRFKKCLTYPLSVLFEVEEFRAAFVSQGALEIVLASLAWRMLVLASQSHHLAASSMAWIAYGVRADEDNCTKP